MVSSLPPFPILFYDGDCGVCNWVVQWVLRRDVGGRFHFAPLQAKHVQAFLTERGFPEGYEEAVVVCDAHGCYVGAEAVLYVWRRLPWPWPWVARLARLVPKSVRRGIYHRIAASEWRMRRKGRMCRLPSPPQAARFWR